MVGPLTQQSIQAYGSISTYGDVLSTLESLAPSLDRTTSALFDPRTRLGTLESKLIAARQRGASLQTIQELEAKIAAVKLQITKEETGVSNANQTRFWTQLGLGSLSLLALSGVLLILSRTFRR